MKQGGDLEDMKAKDFEYDGRNLSDIGYVLCDFNSGGGFETIANGSQISFNTTSVQFGTKQELLSTEYNECLTTVFQICKNPCIYEELSISKDELRQIMKWLNRKDYHKLKILDSDYMDLYFEASFNISRIEMNGSLYGLELNVFTNRPFALHETQKHTIVVENQNEIKSVTSFSDDEGHIYPHTRIEIHADGDLTIYNALDNRTTSISNCISGEIITMDYPMIHSSIESHKIQNDFNWNFLRLANTFKTGKNQLVISLPCKINLSYSPPVKMAI